MNNNAPNNSEFIIFLWIAGTALLCYGIWWLFHEQIIQGLRWVRYGELWLLDKIVSDQDVTDFKNYFAVKDSRVIWQHITISSLIVGQYLHYPVAGILVLCALWIMFRAPHANLKTVYSLDRLIAAQAQIWPVISPIVHFNPAADNARAPGAKLSNTLPLFAEALSPEEWLDFYKVPHSAEGIKREVAAAAFADQLGPRWAGPQSLPLYGRALFAAFALKAARKREEADALLGRIAQSISIQRGGMKFTPDAALKREIEKVIRDKSMGGEAANVAARHAFVVPAMMGVLAYARARGGVLAPAQFLWLRGINRSLWYPLNNLGRQAFHPEAAGAMAHYEAERSAGTPLMTPKVQNAVDAISTYYHDKDVNTVPSLTL